MKKGFVALTVILFCIAAFSVAFLRDLYKYAKTPASQNASPVMANIEPGQSFDEAVEYLKEHKIIVKPHKFKIFARLKNYDREIKAGFYMFSSAMTPEEILKNMVAGKTHRFRVTVPEGCRLEQIADILQEADLVQKTAFLAHANSPEIAGELGIEADSLEGYLFPDTYFLNKGVSSREMIEIMFRQFRKQFQPLWEKKPAGFLFSVHETVTLASIIEKEAGVVQEMPLISSVFHNRLKRNMRLQSDPTVIYGIEEFTGNLTKEHLRTAAPYNTYKIKGLPPGPIASPGAAALKAAIFPAKTRYLFFVAKKDNTHQFSTNYRDHLKAVRKYQLGK